MRIKRKQLTVEDKAVKFTVEEMITVEHKAKVVWRIKWKLLL